MNNSPFIKRIITPIDRFIKLEVSSGILLIISAFLAMVFANSPLSVFYDALLHFPLSIGIGNFEIGMTLHHWVNDVLMVIFFFLVGLEIKRELMVGSLSTKKLAFLPFIAALGGMVVPALIFILFNYNTKNLSGWAIPMATDIAFALGVLTFLSKRVPFSLKIFLLSLATIDDLGAIVVIAFIYSSEVSGFWLSGTALSLFIIFCFKQLRVQSFFVYTILGVVLWLCIYESGIHSTITGVILGLITPVKPLNKSEDLDKELKTLHSSTKLSTFQIEKLKNKLQAFQSPVQLLIDHLHLWVGMIIMPVFAFFNAGVNFRESFSFSQMINSPLSQGIFVGLLIGKPVGVFLFSWLSVKFNLAHWPEGVKPPQILGIGFLAGIGFTMALFISNLSLEYNDYLHNFSKIAILSASIVAGLVGYLILFLFNKMRELKLNNVKNNN